MSASLSPLGILRRLIRRRLSEEGSAGTLNRLLTSQHVADLQFIVAATMVVVVLGCGGALVFEYWHTISDHWREDAAKPHHAWHWLRLFGDSVASSGPLMGAMIAFGGGIIGWAYQAGSARLGTVDLFASEITTLCRVCTIVDLTRSYVKAFEADLGLVAPNDGAAIETPARERVARFRSALSHFEASENYTPVFDQNAEDLQVLDAKVVINVAAFYTYLKAMKDALRYLSKVAAPDAAGREHDAWHDALITVIYMQFLTLESARKAVRDLIEFEPNEVENTIVILISELTAFSFLLNLHWPKQEGAETDDFRLARLQLRKDAYRKIVGLAYWRARNGKEYWNRRFAETAGRSEHERAFVHDVARDWRKAAKTAKELRSRYRLLFPAPERIEKPADLPPPDSLDARGS